MRKRIILGAALLVAVGVIFGALLTMSFNGVGTSLGFQGEKIKLGGPTPITKVDLNLLATQEAFVAVSKAVIPTVVSVTVTTTPKQSFQFFHNFQFNFPEPQPEKGVGSGVIVTSDGYILTNNHVVEDAEKDGIKVRLHDNREFTGRVIGTDPTTDVAVIKIEGKNLPAAALGNSDSVEVGQWVLAIGNPLRLTSTVTAGIVSAIGRNIDISSSQERYGISNFIQTDAAINPGNSGGALVNIQGEVIGINTAIATSTGFNQGYGFAIPINLVRKMAQDLIEYGRVKRPWLGIQMKSNGIDETDARALGMSKPTGVLVEDVMSGTPAEKSGIKSGDVILAIDGKEVDAANEIQTMIAEHRPGDVVAVKIYRDGTALTKDVTLSELPQQNLASTDQNNDEDNENPDQSGQANIAKLGITIQPLDNDTKKQANVESGVRVASVSPTGPAAERSLFQDDIIMEVDHNKINSTKDLVDALKNKRDGDAVMLKVLTKQGNTYVSRFVAVEIGE
ncbi:MAG: Do family serine endopeptidase [Candidatus Kryptoniota bacterium]